MAAPKGNRFWEARSSHGRNLERYPAFYRFLPHDFGEKRTDNSTILDMGGSIYCEPFQVLTPSPYSLGVNKKSTKQNINIEFGEIYVIWAVGTTLYKIGVTTDFRRRFRDLSAASPLPLKELRCAKCDSPHLLEAHLHGIFSEKLFKNEWFSLDSADLNAIDSVFDRYFEKPRGVE